MTSFRKRALAAGLAAIAALLVGFQGATTVLTIAEYGATAKPSETRMASLQADRHAREAARRVKSEPAPVPVEASAPEESQAAAPNPSGVAAAAKAKALAEIEAMEANDAPRKQAPPLRSYRAPHVDKHRIY